jgi:choline kinase
MGKFISVEVYVVDFYEQLLSHFNFHSDQTVLMTSLHKGTNTFLSLFC